MSSLRVGLHCHSHGFMRYLSSLLALLRLLELRAAAARSVAKVCDAASERNGGLGCDMHCTESVML